MIRYAKVHNGKITIKGLEKLEGKRVAVDVKKATRTLEQNAALHLWFTWLSEELREKGISLNMVLRLDIPPTPLLIKELLWRKVQFDLFKTRSTRKLLKTNQIDEIVDVITKGLSDVSNGIIQAPPLPNQQLKDENETKKIYS